MTRTAVLLVDFQNEFAKPEGKLHAAVSKVMEQTNMMQNVPPFVEKARDDGALIIYSPVINLYFGEGTVKFADDENGMDPHAYGEENFLFADGTWNAEIADEVKPKPQDTVIYGRDNFSAFSGTSSLEQTLRKFDIERLFVSGFLTDVCILETVKDLGKKISSVKPIVLMDGCACKSVQTQFATINEGLTENNADCLTTEEAKELLQAEPCSKLVEKSVPALKKTKARRRFTMFDQVKRLRIAMMDKWIAGDRFVRFLDKDANGYVDYDEFYDFLHQFGIAQETHVNVQEVFNILDTQGKGEIPTEVLLEALHYEESDLDLPKGHLEGEILPPFPSPFLVGLVAHNNMKPSMMKFVKDHLSFFSRVKLVTTGSTGRALTSLGLGVEHLVSSGPLGGDQEIGALITQGKVCAVFFFTDPLSAHPHAADIEALNRICCVHDTIFANNPSTAKALLFSLENSPFGYSRLTGLNPEIGKEADVVLKYKEGQAKVIQAVSAPAAKDKADEPKEEVAKESKRKQSIMRAPRPGSMAPPKTSSRVSFAPGNRKSVLRAPKYS